MYIFDSQVLIANIHYNWVVAINQHQENRKKKKRKRKSKSHSNPNISTRSNGLKHVTWHKVIDII